MTLLRSHTHGDSDGILQIQKWEHVLFGEKKNLIEGNRILGAGVFGYYSDCLPVSPYMSRTICITYVAYFKIKHCSGPAVPNSVSKNLWAPPKQHHIVTLTLSQPVLQCRARLNECSLQFHYLCTNNWNWSIKKEKTLVLTVAGKSSPVQNMRTSIPEFGTFRSLSLPIFGTCQENEKEFEH